MIAAHSSSGKPPTPVPNAGTATERAPISSATSSTRVVVRAIVGASVRRSWPMTAPWITCCAARLPAPVATASPSSIGPLATASRSISAPPTPLIARATPAPIQRWLFAAFAIASTSSSAMLPSTTSSSMVQQPTRLRPASAARTAAPSRLAAGRGGCRQTRRLRLERRRLYPEHLRDAVGEPPVPTPEDRHSAGNQQGSNDRDVDEDRHGESEPELLEPHDRAGDEAHEGREHDQPGRRDDATRLGEAEGDGPHVVVRRVPLLAHTAHEEDLVVHRATEDHGEDEHRDPTLDLVEGDQPEPVRRPPLEEDDQESVGRTDREEVEDDRLERDQHRPERAQKQHIGQEQDPKHEPREGAVREVEEVL